MTTTGFMMSEQANEAPKFYPGQMEVEQQVEEERSKQQNNLANSEPLSTTKEHTILLASSAAKGLEKDLFLWWVAILWALKMKLL